MQFSGGHWERQSGRLDQMTLTASQLQDSAPHVRTRCSYKRISIFQKKTSSFSLLLCELMALRISINQVWVQHGYFISQEFALTYFLWAFLRVPFLSTQWSPRHQACAQTCWPNTLFHRTDAVSLYPSQTSGLRWHRLQINHLEKCERCFFLQHSNLKNVNQSTVERIL